MGTLAETANVDYRLSFADQGKQTSVFRFRLQQTNGSFPFPFSVCNKQIEVAVQRTIWCGLVLYNGFTLRKRYHRLVCSTTDLDCL
jgi:hypothetical protein